MEIEKNDKTLTVLFLQGEATNSLIMVNKNDLYEDRENKKSKLEKGGLKLEFELEMTPKINIRPSLWKLLDIITIEFTKNNGYKCEKINVATTLELFDIAKKLGYKVESEVKETDEEREKEEIRSKSAIDQARREINKDLDVLFSLTLSWIPVGKKKSKRNYLDMRLIQSKEFKNGVYKIMLGNLFAEYLVNSYLNKYPLSLLKTNDKNSVVYQLGMKLVAHYNINSITKNSSGDKLKISSILESVGNLKNYESLNDKKHWKRYIKNQIENSLQQLIELGIVSKWEYQKKGGIPVTDEELEKIKYSDYENLYLYFKIEMSDVEEKK